MNGTAPVRKSINIDGTDIAYLEAGEGQPLLLLHGMGHSSTAWLRSIPALAEQRRVLAPDMPGHGGSASPDVVYDPAYFARFVLQFASALGLESVDAAGNSLGALTLMLAALEQAKTLRRLVLVNPLGFTKPPLPPLDDAMLAIIGLWLSFPRTRALIRAGYAANFYDARKLDEESVDEFASRLVRDSRMVAARRTLRGIFHFSKHLDAMQQRFASLESPTLVIWGKNDLMLPSKDAEIARRVLPAPRIEVLERCGHCPHIERPEAFCALVLDFLNAA
ncbi:MAG: alpha/beta fold hydrolase [Candidatus Eremiobacteraeota bacterium]|nr:alpha/beta fold hydrolase [Candidatus Eremiobacteraeota bacterium]